MVDGSIQIMNDEYGGCKQHLFTVSSHEQIEHVCMYIYKQSIFIDYELSRYKSCSVFRCTFMRLQLTVGRFYIFNRLTTVYGPKM